MFFIEFKTFEFLSQKAEICVSAFDLLFFHRSRTKLLSNSAKKQKRFEFWLYKQRCSLLGSFCFSKIQKRLAKLLIAWRSGKSVCLNYEILFVRQKWKQHFPTKLSNKCSKTKKRPNCFSVLPPKKQKRWSVQFLHSSTFQNVCSDCLHFI